MNNPDFDSLARDRSNRYGSGSGSAGSGSGRDRYDSDPRRGGDNGLNRGADQTQVNNFLSSDEFAAQSEGTTVLAARTFAPLPLPSLPPFGLPHCSLVDLN